MSHELLPVLIKDIFDAHERDGATLVSAGTIYLCAVQEIMQGRYLKKRRTRDKALAPDKVRNKTPEDVKAGEAKWDRIHESMKSTGYDYSKPIEFVVRRVNEKRKLHQGHHRVTIAEILGIEHVSVIFRFE